MVQNQMNAMRGPVNFKFSQATNISAIYLLSQIYSALKEVLQLSTLLFYNCKPPNLLLAFSMTDQHKAAHN